MPAKTSTKSIAWVYFDHIVAEAAAKSVHSNPWTKDASGQLFYTPDYNTLQCLLGVPLLLKAGTQSGVPALALDVWLSYEFRRAGFAADQVWPRPSHPRILPAAVAALVNSLTGDLRRKIEQLIATKASIKRVTSASGIILGKNYTKQVDVMISDWSTGPELLVSTKRMDSSYGKNAANRVEESYGDAKNLRLRYPLAALGFVFGLRSDILEKAPNKAEWMFDLLAKLGQEDDAYHSTCLILMDYAGKEAAKQQTFSVEKNVSEQPGAANADEDELPTKLSKEEIEIAVAKLPMVSILHEHTPELLSPSRFLAAMVSRILATTPVNLHEGARRRRAEAEVATSIQFE